MYNIVQYNITSFNNMVLYTAYRTVLIVLYNGNLEPHYYYKYCTVFTVLIPVYSSSAECSVQCTAVCSTQ
jgi:hypothetical protein